MVTEIEPVRLPAPAVEAEGKVEERNIVSSEDGDGRSKLTARLRVAIGLAVATVMTRWDGDNPTSTGADNPCILQAMLLSALQDVAAQVEAAALRTRTVAPREEEEIPLESTVMDTNPVRGLFSRKGVPATGDAKRITGVSIESIPANAIVCAGTMSLGLAIVKAIIFPPKADAVGWLKADGILLAMELDDVHDEISELVRRMRVRYEVPLDRTDAPIDSPTTVTRQLPVTAGRFVLRELLTDTIL